MESVVGSCSVVAAPKGSCIQPIITTTPPNSQTIFPFFYLPRELRDLIYDEALDFKKKLPSQHHLRLRARRSARTNLLLVNRQFREEYSSRAQRQTTLVIVDRDEFLGQQLSLPIPALAPSSLTKLEIHLALACNDICHVHSQGCRVKRELRMHRKWIADVLSRMRGVDSVVVKIVLDPHDHVAHCEALLDQEQSRLTCLEEITDIQVFHSEYESGGVKGWNFARKRSLVMSWDANRRCLARLQKPEVVGPTTNVNETTVKTDGS